MIRLVTTPQLTLLELSLIADELGLSFKHNVNVRRALVERKAAKESFFTDISLYYIVGVQQFRSLELQDLGNKALILLRCSISESAEYALPVINNGLEPISLNDILHLIFDYKNLPARGEIRRSVNLAREILTATSKPSVLQKLQNVFYRIKDKDDRLRVQHQVYRFLCGDLKKAPHTGYEYVDNVVRLPFLVNFKTALSKAIEYNDPDRAAEEFNIDRFELAFVMSKFEKGKK
jgi:hypothetical protein